MKLSVIPSRLFGFLSNASHSHFDAHGNMFSLAMRVGVRGPEYVVQKYAAEDLSDGDLLGTGSVVASVRSRWLLRPSYMHSFAVTEHYFVLVEQPMVVSVPAMAGAHLAGRPMITALKWMGETHSVTFHLINRITGEKESNVTYR